MAAAVAIRGLPGQTGFVRQLFGIVLAVLILFWTLLPIYNMVLISLEPNDSIFSNNIFPQNPTLDSFVAVFTQSQFYVERFWIQLWNSLLVGIGTALITIVIAAMASFSISRLKIRMGGLLSNAALITYVIPITFLAIPFYKIMQGYGLLDNLWSLILVEVTFATPYAIFIFQQYSSSIPHVLDESARVDGASTPQIFLYIFVPLMKPALVAVGTYALLLAWNEYIYAVLLLSSESQRTLPVAIGFFLSADEAPWNVMMATAIIYSIPPLIIYYFFRSHMSTGLTIGGVKG